jgi:hypothetical protein
MKRLGVILALLTISLIVLPAMPTASAAVSTIVLSEPTHRQLDGKFVDDDLAASLLPTGRLGNLVFGSLPTKRSWQIDAELIEEVTSMASGYTLISADQISGQEIAKLWLARLLLVSENDSISALPYGDPSGYWIHRLAPHDVNYFLSAGEIRLQALLKRGVTQARNFSSNRYFSLSSAIVQSYESALSDVQVVAPFLSSSALDDLKLQSALIFSSTMDNSRREFLSRNLTATTYGLVHKIRVVPGRFTVTAAKQQLPITVINDFANSAKVALRVSALNGKVIVKKLLLVTLAANSKTQILVPVEVLTSGTSALAVDVVTPKGDLLGDSVLFPLTLSVISPVATWITTGAAITLFVAALVQSIRRIRRRNK